MPVICPVNFPNSRSISCNPTDSAPHVYPSLLREQVEDIRPMLLFAAAESPSAAPQLKRSHPGTYPGRCAGMVGGGEEPSATGPEHGHGRPAAPEIITRSFRFRYDGKLCQRALSRFLFYAGLAGSVRSQHVATTISIPGTGPCLGLLAFDTGAKIRPRLYSRDENNRLCGTKRLVVLLKWPLQY